MRAKERERALQRHSFEEHFKNFKDCVEHIFDYLVRNSGCNNNYKIIIKYINANGKLLCKGYFRPVAFLKYDRVPYTHSY